MQTFKPGDHVEILATKETGVVTKVISKGILEVQVDDWDVQLYKKKELAHSTKPKTVQEKTAEPVDTEPAKGDVKLCVVSEKNEEELIQTLKYYLLNESNKTLIVNCNYFTGNVKQFNLKLTLNPGHYMHLMNCDFAELNQKVRFLFEIEIKNEKSAPVEKEVKPHPRHFHKKTSKINLSAEIREGVIFIVHTFKQPKTEESTEKIEPFKLKHKHTLKTHEQPKTLFLMQDLEVDLHIEAIPGGKKVEPHESLYFQINYLQKQIDFCIEHGIKKLTAIHGHGKGILKQKVFETAHASPEVSSVSISDNPKYGGGATEIIFFER